MIQVKLQRLQKRSMIRAYLCVRINARRAHEVVAEGILPAVEPGFQPGREGVETIHTQEWMAARPGGRMPALYGRQDAFRYVAVRGEDELKFQLNILAKRRFDSI